MLLPLLLDPVITVRPESSIETCSRMDLKFDRSIRLNTVSPWRYPGGLRYNLTHTAPSGHKKSQSAATFTRTYVSNRLIRLCS